ncbi:MULTISPECIES: hypothetical protein [Pseudomonas]|uniref:hypothetical protein n=1 Tax=Pseudomonas TaxID=286 RepID=UPI000CD43CA2|nr:MULTISPECIES: hypothetical protein [Pseudomonas]WHL28765.1 hypothetical protein QJS63_04715 [Pseudomonas juntendi]MBA6140346.1 hypothetical protein [Pseudomonas monteilii]MDT3749956.1 hypothetical protein [Pseudomonas kurunegalensis]POF91940.1 hypothetical protein BGP83_04270 [Pseudomonas putida]GLO51065.1 hypothetical protein PPUN110474_24650 [Pseudomonas putida]
MTKPFDMALFLNGVLDGSQSTQERHLRQALLIQEAIQQRWKRGNPWSWQLKHVHWFLTQHLKNHSDYTKYYYCLTIRLIWKRLGHNEPSRLLSILKTSDSFKHNQKKRCI